MRNSSGRLTIRLLGGLLLRDISSAAHGRESRVSSGAATRPTECVRYGNDGRDGIYTDKSSDESGLIICPFKSAFVL